MSRPSLLIYTKPPLMGLAKTRLAAGLGRTEARRIAGFLLSHTLRTVRASGCNVTLHVSPDRAAGQPGRFFRTSYRLRPQGPGTLGERLSRGFDEAPPGPVLFIGADAPGLTPALLRRAVRLLNRHDAVFGPAEDGGFWLLGLHKRPGATAPFAGVRWSGPHALSDVRANLPSSFRLGLLPVLQDVDEAKDWRQWTANNFH